ncbi:dihydromonapterin reductase [Pseudoalteromonas fenneropenaei]|uniref:Dihydromonapterin reductase n=1 Tax=Pseudoalteromonas fenneropenaei TaxID=1737459 RepID=A0ABV7CPM9_9GAMM
MNSPILITGGAQRIGLAIVEHLLTAGFTVILSYRTHHPAITELATKGAISLHADFTDNESVTNFIAEVRRHCSSLRAIIHNASSWDCEANREDLATLFDDMMRIHAKVPYLINHGLLDYLARCDEGADIIHITDYVVETGSPKHLAYAASKAALDNLTRSFAVKCAPHIKVNAIAPSLIIFNQHDSDEYKAKTLQKSLMGIEPGCEEVIRSIELLLNSRYITGRSIPVDGGRHLK